MNDTTQTILIVDDVAENIDLLTNLLKDSYRVKASLSGEQALKLIEKGPNPDMILLDIMMPGMDGYEVIKRIKSNEKTRDIPVIFISAMGETGDETKGFALGASDYITKPIRPPVVLARIVTHLTLHKQKEELKKTMRVLENKLSRFCPVKDENKSNANELSKEKVEDDHISYFLDDHRVDLSEYIEEIDSKVYMIILSNRLDQKYLKEVGTLLLKYSNILVLYPIFKHLGTGIHDFSKVLIDDDINPAEDNIEFILGCMESFIYTLEHWHRQIFNNELKDPNIFDNSMLADIQTIQKALTNDYGDDDTEMEFF